MDRRTLLKFASLTALTLSWTDVTQAQTYPNHAIKIIVGFPPGGGTDIAARIIGQKLSDALGQPVVVENRPGAGGTVGNLTVAKSPPDGYTLLLTANGPHAIAPSHYTDLGYDIFHDYAPISLVSSNPQLLAVHPSVPVKSVPELIAWLRAQPADTPATFSSGGNGTPGHLAGELFAAMAGVKLKHVPYRGAAPALAGLLGGEVKVTFGDLAVAVPYASSDKLKPIAVTSLTRSPILPNLPTLDESGLKGYEALVWTGLLAPAGTPPAIVARLNAEMQRIATLPDIKERFAQLSADVAIGTPEAFSDQVRRDFDQWAKVIKDAGIKIQQ
jgi:tripartite-type tricarboxylate transporter receptor subunit TctC